MPIVYRRRMHAHGKRPERFRNVRVGLWAHAGLPLARPRPRGPHDLGLPSQQVGGAAPRGVPSLPLWTNGVRRQRGIVGRPRSLSPVGTVHLLLGFCKAGGPAYRLEKGAGGEKNAVFRPLLGGGVGVGEGCCRDGLLFGWLEISNQNAEGKFPETYQRQ